MNDTYAKARETRQYTEVIYYKNGVEIGRDTLTDDHAYDCESPEPMTEQEIEDWA